MIDRLVKSIRNARDEKFNVNLFYKVLNISWLCVCDKFVDSVRYCFVARGAL